MKAAAATHHPTLAANSHIAACLRAPCMVDIDSVM
jgi:hypothetical protein